MTCTKTYNDAMRDAWLSLSAAGAMSSEPEGRAKAEHHRAQALAWLDFARELRLGGGGREKPEPKPAPSVKPAKRRIVA